MSEIDPVRPPPPPSHDPHGLSRGGSSSEFQEVLRRQAVEKSDAEALKKRKQDLESKEKQKAEKKSESSENPEKETEQKQIEKKKGSLNLDLPVKTSTEKALPSPAAAPLATEKLSTPAKKESPSLPASESSIELGQIFQSPEKPQLSPDEHIGEVLHHPNPSAAPHIGEKKEIISSEEIAVNPTEAKKAAPTPVTGTIARVIGQLPPQIADMFERMAGVMTIMNNTGMRQTTIELNSPQFANSPYFGSKIVIQEFNAAPKVFNIMLIGSPQAVTSFQAQLGSLQAAFQAGDYAFRVHRLETSLVQEDAPVLERKEAASHDEEKQGKQGK